MGHHHVNDALVEGEPGVVGGVPAGAPGWAGPLPDPLPTGWKRPTMRLGRALFGLGWLGLGLTHFLTGSFLAGRAPAWPPGWPGQEVAAYVSGGAFVLAGAAVLAGRGARPAVLVTGGLVALWALARHLPVVAGSGLLAPEWTQAGKAFVFTGGALAVAFSSPSTTGHDPATPASTGARGGRLPWLSHAAAVTTTGGFLMVTGAQHFLYTPFVAGLIPGWFPGDAVFWTRTSGIALIGGGLGLLIPRSREWAAVLAGSMVLCWFFVVHVNQEVTGAGDGLAVHEALVVAGILFVIAGWGAVAARSGARRHTLRALALVGILALAGCDHGAPPGDGTDPVEAPVPFAPGAIPAEWEQYRVAFTPSEDTAYFAAGTEFFPVAREATIYELVRTPAGWSDPRAAPFSGDYPDIDPFVTGNGTALLFSSIRPVDGEVREAVDLWRVPREGEGWGEAERLDASSDRDDLFPSLDPEGRLYFARPLPNPDRGGEWGIWVAQPRASGQGWDEPQPLGDQVNAPGWWSFNPVVSADGELLVFTRLNPADAPATGFGELHWSPREGTGWGPAHPVGDPVNTPADEFHPGFSPDGAVLYFVRRDPGAQGARGRLYQVPVAAIRGLP